MVDLGRDQMGKRIRRFSNVKGTRRDAERELSAVIHAIDSGTYTDPSRELVGAFLDRWLRDGASVSVAPRTYERYQEAVAKHIGPALGSLRLTALRPAHIVAAEKDWQERGRCHGGGGLSASTVRHHHAVLRKALQTAVRWQLIAVNPAIAVTPPRAIRREMLALDVDQASKFLDALGGTEFEVPLLTALYTGLRLSELRGLRWRDADLTTGHLRIQQTLQRRADGRLTAHETKTHRSRRSVAIPSTVVEALRALRPRQAEARLLAGAAWEEGDFVFADGLGRPLNESRLRGAFHRTLSEAGLPQLRLHDLRHSMASLMLSAGEHPKIVSERLGHSSVGITLDLYSHVLPGLGEAAAERMVATLTGRH